MWSDSSQRLGKIEWLLNFSMLAQRNIRSSTEFIFRELLAYWVRTYSIGVESSKLKLSAISLRESTYVEYKGFQSLSLMLKSPVIIRTLFKFTLVFLRYFKANC